MKAYKITADVTYEPWHWENVVVYASKASEAKYKALPQFEGAEVRDYEMYSNKREVQYKDLNARRIPEFDKADYRGELLTKAEIREKEWCEQRDENALAFTLSHPNSLFVVWAGVYGAYWGANRSGYTSNLELAGKYSAKDAYDIVRGSDHSRQESVILLDAEKYNKEIEDKIEKLKASKI